MDIPAFGLVITHLGFDREGPEEYIRVRVQRGEEFFERELRRKSIFRFRNTGLELLCRWVKGGKSEKGLAKFVWSGPRSIEIKRSELLEKQD